MRNFLFVFMILASGIAKAQKSLPTPRNITETYEKGTRSISGAPGKNYWQNKADYKLEIEYAPSTRLLSGTATIYYTNNSPDTLRELNFHLNMNYYKNGVPRQSFVSPKDLGDGIIIDSAWVDEKAIAKSTVNANTVTMRLRISPLSTGKSIHLRFQYHYTLNKGSHNRTGEIEPGAAFIAYFFPRIAVYDDVDGWNRFAYNGSQEFYNDFCNFEARITVPENFVVWATGDLKNAKDVLGPVYVDRLNTAERENLITTIIDSTDLKTGHITTASAKNTFHFEAKNVTDFVFATSDHYLWKSTSLVVDPTTNRRTRVDAVFNAKHKDYFKVVEDARQTVHEMSYTFPAWPFPYNHITVFDGLDQMEYPMMVNDNPVDQRDQSVELTVHEVFHTMFPFYLGTNETKYAWMDEGWASVGEWLIAPMIDSTIVDEYGIGPYSGSAGEESDLPMITVSTQLRSGYFVNAYAKPAMVYLYLKDMLGESLFKKAMHVYIDRWNGRHPISYDFFYSINAGSGRNLNWYWKNWFFDWGFPDLGITSVTRKGKAYTVVVKNIGGKYVPIDLNIEYTDGSSEKVHRSVAVWEKAPPSVTINIATSKKIKKVVIQETHVSDVNRMDNEYIAR